MINLNEIQRVMQKQLIRIDMINNDCEESVFKSVEAEDIQEFRYSMMPDSEVMVKSFKLVLDNHSVIGEKEMELKNLIEQHHNFDCDIVYRRNGKKEVKRLQLPYEQAIIDNKIINKRLEVYFDINFNLVIEVIGE